MNDQEKLHEEHCCCGHDHEHEHEHHHDHDCCDYEHEHHHDHDCCGHDHEHHHHDGCCDDDDDDCCCGHSCSCAACSGEEKEAGAKDIILLVISVALVGASFLIPQGPHGIFRLLVQAVATLLVGWELFWKGLKGLLRFSLDETTLMTIAVVAAFAIGEGFEGAMVTILYQIGEYFEDRAVMNSRKRIDALVSIVPENANLLNPDGSVTEVPASQLEPGDLLLVRAGDRVPLDCDVLEGEGQVDTAAITGTVSTDGSTSMEKVIGALSESFMAANGGVTVNYNPTGSGSGITAVQEGTCDIGLSSRALKDEEKAAGLKETVLAYDGIAIIVHPDNPVSDLTLEQIAKLYTGEITNWKDVGGNDAEVVLIGREAASGTRDGFESITGTKDACQYRQELTSTGDVITAVSQNPDAIGYASLASVKDTVKALNVGGVTPSEATVKDGSYLVQRPFVLVTVEGKALSPAAQAFFDYALSADAASIISAAGAVAAN